MIIKYLERVSVWRYINIIVLTQSKCGWRAVGKCLYSFSNLRSATEYKNKLNVWVQEMMQHGNTIA